MRGAALATWIATPGIGWPFVSVAVTVSDTVPPAARDPVAATGTRLQTRESRVAKVYAVLAVIAPTVAM